MVDTPAPVVIERVAEIVPIGVLHAVGIELAEYIDESPPDGVPVSFARVDVKIGIVDAAIGVVHIDRFGRDIQIAEPDGGLAGIEPLTEIAAHAMKPFQLEHILVGADPVALRDISVDDGNADRKSTRLNSSH